MEKFVWSVKNGETKEVKEFVEQQGVDVNKQIEGRFPLHYAADYGQTEVIKYLIERGADVNLSDKHGITPVLAAIWEGHTESVQVLLAKGAKKKGNAPDGTPYVECAEKEEIKKLLQ